MFAAYKGTAITIWDTLTEKIITKIVDAHKKQVTSLCIFSIIQL